MVDDFSKRAAVGQASNQAVSDAISLGRQNDTRYIVERFHFYKNLNTMLQGCTDAQIVEVLEGNGKKLDEISDILKALTDA